MWSMWIFVFSTVILTISGAPSNVCPENCQCSLTETTDLKATCTSLEFLEKLRPKQIKQIVELELSRLSLKVLPAKLKKLKNLRRLDLSGNLIADVSGFPYLPKLTRLSLRGNNLGSLQAEDLPKSIEELDLAENHISDFEQLVKLPKLKKVDIADNYINCDCAFVKTRNVLIDRNVNFVQSAKCFSPGNVNDVPLLRVYCVNNAVLYDDLENFANDEPIENEFMRVEHEVPEADRTNFEGSGFEGSGEVDVTENPNVKNCYFGSCSTEPSLEVDDSLPKAGISDIIDAVLDKTDQPPETDVKSDEGGENEKEITEAPIMKEESNNISVQESPGNTRKIVETPKEESAPVPTSDKRDPLQSQEQTNGSSSTTYVIVAALFVVMAALIAYVVVKRRKNRGPSDDAESKAPAPVEMKPLVHRTNGNDQTAASLPEKTPLMNSSQNGHAENGDAAPNNVPDTPQTEKVETRDKPNDLLLTPETKRVTIQAKEMPSPKSPTLVHRNNDGKFTVTSSQENRD